MLHTVRFQRVLTLLLALLMVFSLLQAFGFSALAAPPLPEYNGQPRGVVCTTLSADAESYYTGQYTYENLTKLSGASNVSTSARAMENNDLYDALNDLMTSTHKFQTTYSGTGAGSLAYYWDRTDSVQGSTIFQLFYSNVPSPGYKGSDFNREHVWPKSNASFVESGGGSDLHHLRPANPSVNSTRGNLPFGNVQGLSGATTGYCYWKTSSLFEPLDIVKGDVARILLYVYVRWGENNIYSTTSNGSKIIESLDTLLEWMVIDPVDTWEMRRNDLIEEVQGNRNVFIDYPELAFKLFSRSVPDDLVTPSSSAVCTHNYKLISSTPATCLDPGEKVYVCTLCGKDKTEYIDALGHIDRNDDGECDRCGMFLDIEVVMHLKTTITDGAHLIIFNPSKNLVLTDVVTNNKIEPLEVASAEDLIFVPPEAVIFTAEAYDDAFRFVTPDGGYLTSAPTGNGLYYEQTPNEYSLWRLESAGGTLFRIVNVNAKYNNSVTQALELYYGKFTTYGVKTGDPNFEYNIYAANGHVWDKGVVTLLPGTAVHELTQTCVICGAHKTTILDRRQGDYDLDAELTIADVTCMLNMLATSSDWTQDDDLDGDGSFNISDVTLMLDVLSHLKS